MRALSPATRQRVRAALGDGPLGAEMVDFVEAVVLQSAHPLGGEASRGAASERRVADHVIEMLNATLGDERAVASAARTLAADRPLLAIVFQNLDLLPAPPSSRADAIALLVVLALSRLEEGDASGSE